MWFLFDLDSVFLRQSRLSRESFINVRSAIDRPVFLRQGKDLSSENGESELFQEAEYDLNCLRRGSVITSSQLKSFCT